MHLKSIVEHFSDVISPYSIHQHQIPEFDLSLGKLIVPPWLLNGLVGAIRYMKLPVIRNKTPVPRSSL